MCGSHLFILYTANLQIEYIDLYPSSTIYCVSLVMLPKLSVFQFPYMNNKTNNIYLTRLFI